MAATIGLMEGAYFVGRKEIMDFINNTLELRLGKVEDTASGCVACQLLDIMYPSTVPMNKVNWSANKDFEYVGNYKILQTCFTKLHIDRHIDVDRLISGKYMDNLEFMQWFKRYFELNGAEKGSYDCKGQRAKGKGGSNIASSGSKPSAVPTRPTPAPKVIAPVKTTPTPAPVTKTAPPVPTPSPAYNSSTSTTATKTSTVKKTDDSDKVAALTAELDALKFTGDETSKAFSELRQEMDGLEKERDFYFDKLRDIEIILQDTEDSGNGSELTAAVFKILYATQVCCPFNYSFNCHSFFLFYFFYSISYCNCCMII